MALESRVVTEEPLATNVVANLAAGDPMNVSDFRHVQVQLVGSGGANATVKIKASLNKVAPNFSAAAGLGNEWAYIAMYDYNDPSSIIVGSTGYVFAADGVANLLVNVDLVRHVALEVSGYAAGRIDAKCVSAMNQ